jgi:Tol biopolymer transport system component
VRTLAFPQVFPFVADPDWSPDGRTLAYIAGDTPGRSALWTIGGNGRGLKRLLVGQDLCCVAWSPDGRTIAFSDARGIGVLPRGGGAVSRVDAQGEVGDWSRGGLAFARDGAVYVVDPRSGVERRIAAGEEPDWSPDGKRLAFTRGGRLYVGSRALRLPAELRARLPVWAPVGDVIVFAGNKCVRRYVCSDAGLWSIRPDGSRLRRLTAAGVDATWGEIAWQPRHRGSPDPA